MQQEGSLHARIVDIQVGLDRLANLSVPEELDVERVVRAFWWREAAAVRRERLGLEWVNDVLHEIELVFTDHSALSTNLVDDLCLVEVVDYGVEADCSSPRFQQPSQQ